MPALKAFVPSNVFAPLNVSGPMPVLVRLLTCEKASAITPVMFVFVLAFVVIVAAFAFKFNARVAGEAPAS